MRGPIVIFAGMMASGAAIAEPVVLANEAIKSAVDGATVEIDTPLGSTVPMRFATDGTVSGEAGKVAFYLGAETDHGKWWVARNQLCQRWTIWFKGEISCLRIKRDGQKIAWQRSSDLEEGTATLIPKAPIEPPVKAQRSALGGPVAPPGAPPSESIASTPPTSPSPAFAVASIAAAPEVRAEPAPATRAQPMPPRVAASPLPARAVPQMSRRAAVVQNKPKIAAARSRVALLSTPAGPSFWVNGVARDDVLNMREGPSSEAEVVGEIPSDGRGVRIIGDCRDMWCLVSFDGVKGWVNRSYLMYELPNAIAPANRSATIPTTPSRERGSRLARDTDPAN